ncbi:MAG: hypothetical protein J7M24_06030 [Candidatus Latescibacteria bacterium]|nr:hypothetical protein [Candidatus Latescibacterota bacterium]
MRYPNDIKRFLLAGIFFLSCAGVGKLDRYRPIMGYWETERGVVMSIRLSSDEKLIADVKASPGYLAEDILKTDALIDNIEPLVDGRFSGVFRMPGGAKPLKVVMALTDPNTLLIMTWDRRAKGKRVMRWTRIEKLPDAAR